MLVQGVVGARINKPFMYGGGDPGTLVQRAPGQWAPGQRAFDENTIIGRHTRYAPPYIEWVPLNPFFLHNLNPTQNNTQNLNKYDIHLGMTLIFNGLFTDSPTMRRGRAFASALGAIWGSPLIFPLHLVPILKGWRRIIMELSRRWHWEPPTQPIFTTPSFPYSSFQNFVMGDFFGPSINYSILLRRVWKVVSDHGLMCLDSVQWLSLTVSGKWSVIFNYCAHVWSIC